MIARIWKGKTKIEHLEEYTEFMKIRAIPDYKKTDGLTFWKNIEVIKSFVGDDFEKAKYYPEDNNYLIDFPEKVTHYEVFAE
ncbi:antibiotic biosynthesis monooxygenase [Pontimicrobium sp. SW4]|uniref:Antibiotic biosynthesis monooxygenase n=1 Tax=Pontimicrobium sp. SW4 TaxID=3153519 RepID=A0AAU7BRT1_9FLAO